MGLEQLPQHRVEPARHPHGRCRTRVRRHPAGLIPQKGNAEPPRHLAMRQTVEVPPRPPASTCRAHRASAMSDGVRRPRNRPASNRSCVHRGGSASNRAVGNTRLTIFNAARSTSLIAEGFPARRAQSADAGRCRRARWNCAYERADTRLAPIFALQDTQAGFAPPTPAPSTIVARLISRLVIAASAGADTRRDSRLPPRA